MKKALPSMINHLGTVVELPTGPCATAWSSLTRDSTAFKIFASLSIGFQEQSHQNRAYSEAWFVWWVRFGSGRGERSRLESRLSRSIGSDGWLDSGGPLPTVRCLQGGRKVVDNAKQAPFFYFYSLAHNIELILKSHNRTTQTDG
jgi:hypothetical protein